MISHKKRQKIKISVQVKSVLILATVVLLATSGGGWFYYAAARDVLRQNDEQQASQLGSGLAMSAAPSLTEGNAAACQRLVGDLISKPKVQSAAILDRLGRTVAVSTRVGSGFERTRPVTESPSLSYEARLSPEFLEVGRPVLVPDADGKTNTLVGGIRLILDTRPTAAMLAGLQREVYMVGALVVLLVIPLGQLLVWRVVATPIRRLVEATRRLAEGDFSARVQTHRNDEIGALASSFDTMAEELQASQIQLHQANESLERKVADRTVELERANGKLREEMAEKEDFLRAVSHDLNAPLRNIAGMATMISLRYRENLPEEVIARLQRIQANVDAGTDLLGELLELSRVKTRPQRRRMVDFEELLEELRGTFEYELKAKGVDLSIHGPMPTLHVERNRMRQVFQNLIDNAIKYMDVRADARIDLSYRLVDGMHEFRVVDNGPGVSPEDRERIFYVFRRGANAEQAAIPGKGVGLALVRTIVQTYDGRAWVESDLGHGADFCFALRARCTQPDMESPLDQTSADEPEYAVVTHDSAD